MKYLTLLILIVLCVLIIIACTPQKNLTKDMELDFGNPPTMVYKTKVDYSKNVPVILSDDKSKIVSYPHPKDVFYNGKLAYPTTLSKNYLLDNRGINQNVAFLNMTYEEYSKLEEAPDVKELYSKIIDKDPLKELCNCGNRQQFEDIELLKNLVEYNLSKCKRLK